MRTSFLDIFSCKYLYCKSICLEWSWNRLRFLIKEIQEVFTENDDGHSLLKWEMSKELMKPHGFFDTRSHDNKFYLSSWGRNCRLLLRLSGNGITTKQEGIIGDKFLSIRITCLVQICLALDNMGTPSSLKGKAKELSFFEIPQDLFDCRPVQRTKSSHKVSNMVGCKWDIQSNASSNIKDIAHNISIGNRFHVVLVMSGGRRHEVHKSKANM